MISVFETPLLDKGIHIMKTLICCFCVNNRFYLHSIKYSLTLPLPECVCCGDRCVKTENGFLFPGVLSKSYPTRLSSYIIKLIQLLAPTLLLKITGFYVGGGGGVLTRPKWTKLPKCIFYLILFNWRPVNF